MIKAIRRWFESKRATEAAKEADYIAGRLAGYKYALAAYERGKDLEAFYYVKMVNIPEYRDGTAAFRDGFEDGVINVWDRQDIEQDAKGE